jgi:hypothetical protein
MIWATLDVLLFPLFRLVIARIFLPFGYEVVRLKIIRLPLEDIRTPPFNAQLFSALAAILVRSFDRGSRRRGHAADCSNALSQLSL